MRMLFDFSSDDLLTERSLLNMFWFKFVTRDLRPLAALTAKVPHSIRNSQFLWRIIAAPPFQHRSVNFWLGVVLSTLWSN